MSQYRDLSPEENLDQSGLIYWGPVFLKRKPCGGRPATRAGCKGSGWPERWDRGKLPPPQSMALCHHRATSRQPGSLPWVPPLGVHCSLWPSSSHGGQMTHRARATLLFSTAFPVPSRGLTPLPACEGPFPGKTLGRATSNLSGTEGWWLAGQEGAGLDGA